MNIGVLQKGDSICEAINRIRIFEGSRRECYAGDEIVYFVGQPEEMSSRSFDMIYSESLPHHLKLLLYNSSCMIPSLCQHKSHIITSDYKV